MIVSIQKTAFPPGWNEDRIRSVLSRYESQPEEEAVAEDKAVFDASGRTVMKIPMEPASEIRRLIAEHKAA
uniref:Uncharacterized protein n=1 Tax=Candidatus Kentrum sp. LPFa TaxID=2126335 RepID=A0A450W351_9GAMM|nr:MAG: hypothetical protein BECKLPF1236B_GA0070989_102222 [Candidatus Kentron sp. LPFa]